MQLDFTIAINAPAGTSVLDVDGDLNEGGLAITTVNGSFVVAGADPDFNNDGVLNGIDLDLLQANIVDGPADPGTFDLTGDGTVTIADRNEWLVQRVLSIYRPAIRTY